MDGVLNTDRLNSVVSAFKAPSALEKAIRDEAIRTYHRRLLMVAWMAIHAPIPSEGYIHLIRQRKLPKGRHFGNKFGMDFQDPNGDLRMRNTQSFNAKWEFQAFSVCPVPYRTTADEEYAEPIVILSIEPGTAEGFWNVRFKRKGKRQWLLKPNAPTKSFDPWLGYWLKGGNELAGIVGPEVPSGYILDEKDTR